MKAIVVTDQAAGTAGMKLAERSKPLATINDVLVQVHAAGFVGTELAWPSTWADRLDRDRTPTIPGHELAGVVAAGFLVGAAAAVVVAGALAGPSGRLAGVASAGASAGGRRLSISAL